MLSPSGQTFPVHPLDLTQPQLLQSSLQDGTIVDFLICPSSLDINTIPFGDIDIILGDSFLKNTYSSYVSSVLCVRVGSSCCM